MVRLFSGFQILIWVPICLCNIFVQDRAYHHLRSSESPFQPQSHDVLIDNIVFHFLNEVLPAEGPSSQASNFGTHWSLVPFYESHYIEPIRYGPTHEVQPCDELDASPVKFVPSGQFYHQPRWPSQVNRNQVFYETRGASNLNMVDLNRYGPPVNYPSLDRIIRQVPQQGVRFQPHITGLGLLKYDGGDPSHSMVHNTIHPGRSRNVQTGANFQEHLSGFHYLPQWNYQNYNNFPHATNVVHDSQRYQSNGVTHTGMFPPVHPGENNLGNQFFATNHHEQVKSAWSHPRNIFRREGPHCKTIPYNVGFSSTPQIINLVLTVP